MPVFVNKTGLNTEKFPIKILLPELPSQSDKSSQKDKQYNPACSTAMVSFWFFPLLRDNIWHP